ncbi:putative harbinger transposase-derived nuclease domain-containing protein [Helianthus annuus]|nr:putative harbinger transposase-derived nuclease domain-containing protein [Helianthus annuus]KAJ0459960.1 putative harbinger transposase-derived nuclease domain-containing protein [Helianthus annuus]
MCVFNRMDTDGDETDCDRDEENEAEEEKNWLILPDVQDCIGAIDGTHVRASVREHEQPKYIGRKGYATQNIMAACDFNMCFTFAWAGWEGAAHDTRIFNEALRRPEINFPHPIGDKYYVVDAGYPNTRDYLAPYKGTNIRYHLPDFRRGKTVASRAPRGPKEIFNYHHSSLRNVIERTFGVWKARWEILQHMHINYTYETQVKIVLASMAIHNYIRKKDTCDEGFTMAEQESYTPNNGRGSNDINEVNEDTSTQHRIDDLYMSAVRDMIAGDLTKPR